MISRLLVPVLFLLLVFETSAQLELSRFHIDVTESSTTLPNPWTGGLNNPQFSEIDLDNDGMQDIFIFDRQGSRVMTLLNMGGMNYRYAPEFHDIFPKKPNWMLLRDANCDGLEDLYISYSASGGIQSISLYLASRSGGLNFKLEDTILEYDIAGTPAPVFVNIQDIPVIDDINYDGDMDIISFRAGGGFIAYYENLGIENGGTCTDDEYFLVDNCWGDIYESGLKKEVDLDSCGTLITTPPKRHAGSTLLTIDLDNDTLKDMILGDITFKNLVMLNNKGTLTDAHAISQDTAFPSYDVPVDLSLFPATYHLDIDNDGLKDLIVSPNADNLSENFDNVIWYKNTGSATVPDFTFQSDRFLVDGMIEVGSHSKPVVVDHNADGLPDLVVGNYGYFETSTGRFRSQFALYENVGTNTDPEFELVSRDWAGLSSFSSLYDHFAPTFGDLDGDGDLDMLVGHNDGELMYFENTAGAGATMSFKFPVTNYAGIDVGQYSHPQLIDLNRDGLLDLVIGEKNGNINYYQNMGADTLADFSIKTRDTLGGIVVSTFEGYSTPHFYAIDDSTFGLLVGNVDGEILEYDNIDGNILGAYNLLSGDLSDFDEGKRSTAFIHDLNDDGLIELICGNAGGGLTLFSELMGSSIDEINEHDFRVYPNPAGDFFVIESNGTIDHLRVVDALGCLKIDTEVADNNIRLQVNDLPPGIYIIQVEQEEQWHSRKLLVY